MFEALGECLTWICALDRSFELRADYRSRRNSDRQGEGQLLLGLRHARNTILHGDAVVGVAESTDVLYPQVTPNGRGAATRATSDRRRSSAGRSTRRFLHPPSQRHTSNRSMRGTSRAARYPRQSVAPSAGWIGNWPGRDGQVQRTARTIARGGPSSLPRSGAVVVAVYVPDPAECLRRRQGGCRTRAGARLSARRNSSAMPWRPGCCGEKV